MGISAKSRRKMVVEGTTYLWWVAPDEDSPFEPCMPAVTVAAPDRSLLLRYHLQQPDDRRHVTVLGPRFRDTTGCGGPWRRFRCPRFDDDGVCTPAHAAALIRWATEPGPADEVNYLGLPIGSELVHE